ncbi:MAG: sulfatase-like hydrolase/transferase [Trueperaceae bacterium]|nr:sulfatase-like hydrolase/transferase [Trueperaceae bacterium]
MTDHQRADTVLPEHPAKMPNLDAYMQEAVNFTQAYCPSPHCCPSRATFFTGLYPSRHGVWNNVCNEQALSRGLNDDVQIFSDGLRQAGYDLFYSGKWHISSEERPSDRGWQELFVSAVPGTHHGRKWEDYEKGAGKAQPRTEGSIRRPGYGNFLVYGTAPDEGDKHDEEVVRQATQQLRKLKGSSNPWCLYVGVNAPHDPYVVPQRYLDLYELEDISLPESYYDTLTDKPGLYRRLKEQIFGQMSEDEVRNAIRHFWAFCSYIDDMFGKILKALDESGQAQDTLVLFCADHGDYCGDHGLFAKGIACFEGAYHIPAAIRFPAGVKNPGRSVDSFVSLADFAPTFLEVAGLQPQHELTGKSLMPFLLGEEPDTWREAIFTQCNGVELYYIQRSVKTKDYKYVFNGFDFDELYDLRNDPYEMNNLANKAGMDSIKQELLRQLWRFAYQEHDTSALNPYVTVSLAPYGPGEAFEDGKSK